MEYEPVIGLEVHAQLLTESKMFCSCAANYIEAPPNSHVCPICLGMPGVLPVINKKAVEYTIMAALALNCSIAQQTKFDRKNYPYPDLMKGYQISQYDMPLSKEGWLTIDVDGHTKRVGITRVHLEEDTAKLHHREASSGKAYSQVDVNRSGVPLMEIVGEPELRSPEEARQYLVKVRSILQYLGVSSGNMEDGSFRCDANISIRPKGSSQLYTKVEVKNMNSFKAVYKALQYEVERQIKATEEERPLVQETRGWVEEQGITVSQRSKEYAHDYRYFPEPDLPSLTIDIEWVEEIRKRLPELPDARRERFTKKYDLSPYDARLLTSSKEMADFFEQCLKLRSRSREAPSNHRAKVVSNWMLGDFSHLLNAQGVEIFESKVTPETLSEMLDLIEDGTLSGKMAKTVFEEMFRTGKKASQVVKEQGLAQMSDTQLLAPIIEEVISSNPQPVADFMKGKEQALKFLVGQVMKATRGQANPALVNQFLEEKLRTAKKD